jgi:hypothetical protein
METLKANFEPVEVATRRMPEKYRRIGRKLLAAGFSLNEVGYIFGVTGSAVHYWGRWMFGGPGGDGAPIE